MTNQETGNQRWHRHQGDFFWYGLALSAALHMLMFSFWPTMTTADVSFESDVLESIEIPDQIDIPPPPQQIARPATPVISTTVMSEEITIAPTTFEANPVENLPPPPTASASAERDLAAAPTFTPHTVRPEILNRDEVARVLSRNYPPLLRDAGISGSPTVHFFINEEGKAVKWLINKSSGYNQMDEAALAVASVMRFSPALNGTKKVPVWVEIPIVFKVQ